DELKWRIVCTWTLSQVLIELFQEPLQLLQVLANQAYVMPMALIPVRVQIRELRPYLSFAVIVRACIQCIERLIHHLCQHGYRQFSDPTPRKCRASEKRAVRLHQLTIAPSALPLLAGFNTALNPLKPILERLLLQLH